MKSTQDQTNDIDACRMTKHHAGTARGQRSTSAAAYAGVVACAGLMMCAGLTVSVYAQPATDTASAPASSPTTSPGTSGPTPTDASPATPAPATPELPVPVAPTAPVVAVTQPAVSVDGVSFNFKDTPIDQALDFFAREYGLPIIFESPAPAGVITFISPTKYSLSDALSILNLNLARLGVHLRKQDQYLYLATLTDSMKKPAPVSDVSKIDTLTPDQIITVSIPLDNARAEQVVEQIKPLIGSYGGVIAVPIQNMVVVVESAGQVKRIREIIASIDAVRPVDSQFKLFPLRHAQAETVLTALRGLVGEKVTTVIVDKDGQKRTIQEQNLAGLSLASDPRTNAIIGVGSANRLKTVEELVALLDTPNVNGAGEPAGPDQQMQTFALSAVDPDDAARQLAALYVNADPKKKPVVIPLNEARKVTVIGPSAALLQAAALLAQMDPGVSTSQGAGNVPAGLERRGVVVALKFAQAKDLEAILSKLLPARVNQAVKFAASPDGKAMVVTGPARDVSSFEEMLRALDVQNATESQVKVVTLRNISSEAANAAITKAKAAYIAAGKDDLAPVSATLDEQGSSVTIIAPIAAVKEFETILEPMLTLADGAEESRTFAVTKSLATDVAGKLQRMSAVLFRGEEVQPTIDAIEELRMVAVRARPRAMIVLAGLIEQLDGKDTGAKEVRIIPIAGEKAKELRDRAFELYSKQIEGSAVANPANVTIDETTNSLVVIAPRAEVDRFSAVVGELQRQSGPAREIRLFEIKLAKAADVAAFLRDMSASSATMQVNTSKPVFEVIEATNSIMAAAQPSQFAVIETLVRSLDSQQAAERPPVRILQLRSTDALNLAAILQREFDKRPIEMRGKQPVGIEADAGTNTLIVSASGQAMEQIEQIVSSLNDAEAKGSEGREIRIFPLRVARAEELAQTIDQMFPQPPIPLDPRTRQPRPDLAPPREVVVRADRTTNSLIVDAPAKRLTGFEQIVKSLDQTKVSGDVMFRTYKLERADVNAMAQTIRDMAANGALTATAGATPTTVTVEPATKTLIVSTRAEAFVVIEDVINKIEQSQSVTSTDLKMRPLEKARAERLAPIVQRLLAAKWRESRLAAGKADEPAAVEVTADVPSNTLIISAPREVMATAEAVVASLDSQSTASAKDLRVFRLTKGQAATVAPAVAEAVRAQNTAGDAEATVTPEPSSNTITVVGTPVQIERAAKLIESLDATVDREGLGVKSVTLKNARASTLAPVLQRLLEQESGLDKLPEWARMQAMARGAVEAPRIRVVADERINAVVISGPRSVLDVAEQITSELDLAQSSSSMPARAIRIVTLQNADAQQLAANITAVFAEEVSTEPPPTIRVDAQSNALIIRGTDSQLHTVSELTKSLDNAAAVSSRQMRTIAVDRSKVDATLLAKTLQRMLEQQGSAKVEIISAEELLRREQRSQEQTPASGDEAKDNTEPKKTSYYVPAFYGTPTVSFRGSRVLSDPKSDSNLSGVVAGLTFAGIWAAMATAQDVPADAANPVTPPAVVGVPQQEDIGVTIAVDKATNSLVVVGSPRMTDRISSLASKLSEQLPAEPAHVRIVTLTPGTDAAALNQVLNQTIAQIRQSSLAAGGFTGPVNISLDPSGSALIIFANDTDFTTIAELVVSLSKIDPAVPTTIRVVPLSNTTAQRAIQAIRELFSGGQGIQARRIRSLDLEVTGADGNKISAERVDPSQIRISSDPSGTSLLIAAPSQAMPLIDALIETIDQNPLKDRLAIKHYTLQHARASELAGTFQGLFESQRQGPTAWELPQARFIADERTNTLLVTASTAQHKQLEVLLTQSDVSTEQSGLTLAIITLQQASPTAIARMVDEIVIGKDTAKRDRVRMSAQDNSSVLIVRAADEELKQIRELVAQLDSAEVAGLPVRSIKVERADAAVIAQTLMQFFQQRAQVSSRPGQRVVNRVAVMGEKRTGTLIVCAGDEDYKQIEGLVKTFDTPSPAAGMVFKVVPLRNALVSDIGDIVRNIIDEVRWTAMMSGRNNGDERQLFLEVNDAANSVVLFGHTEQIETVEKIIAGLDVAPEQRALMSVKSIEVKNADLNAVRTVLERAFATPNWRSWRGPDPAAITVQIDRVRKGLILLGKSEQLERASAYIAELDGGATGAERTIEAISLNHARAERAANNLRQFFIDRARSQGVEGTTSGVTILGSTDGNVLVVSAGESDLKVLKDLIAQIDQPDAGKDRRIEVFVMRNGIARDTADVLRSMFTKADSPGERVVITPQPSTNSLVVSAPEKIFEEVTMLLRQLDAPPKAEEANIETVALTTARAVEVATAVRAALPPNVKVTVTPVARSNSLLLTGSKEAIALVLDQVKKIDQEPVRTGAVFRRYTLKNADAFTVSDTIEQVLDARPRNANDIEPSVDYSRQDNTVTVYAPSDQMQELESIISELDKESTEERITEFVKLDFANADQTAAALKVFYGRFASEAATPAARNVTILADPLSNSLVIRADQKQWEGIRALLTKLDTKEYDTRRQLAVIPLTYADSVSIARALNEGFRAPLEEQLRQAQARAAAQARVGGNQNRAPLPEATVLIDPEGLPSVSSEPQTNSLIIFAGQKELTRITEAVKQLDVSGFANMPAARIIPLANGRPSVVASTIRELYLNKGDRSQQLNGPRAVLVIGDDASGSLIVRADDEKFAQIKTLAQTLEQQGEVGRVIPHVVRLRSIAAGRLRSTIINTFTETAKQQGETLAVEVDRSSNSLVIACSERLLVDIRKVIDELDSAVLAPGEVGPPEAAGLGQSVFVIDLNHNSPADMKRMLESLGVSQPVAVDRPGIVAEPVQISTLATRRAIAVVAGAADGRIIESLVKSLDAAPAEAGQVIAVMPLKMASATPVVQMLTSMLDPKQQAVQTGAAQALSEQVRRMGIVKNGAEQTDKALDLSKPIRLVADAEANSVVIVSTQPNVDAVRELVKLLDTLPVGDAVIVRIFPLSNSSAGRVQQVITQLFSQGEALRRLPGTRRQGLPPTATGQALAGEIAAAVDERTNTLIVAGREEAVALVEVLIKDLDGDRAANWIEPAILPLKFADSSTLARTLQDVLVRGLTLSPEAVGLQRQYGRLRMVEQGGVVTPETPAHAPDDTKPVDRNEALAKLNETIKPRAVEADLFAPVTGLVITSEPQLNALIVVGTPANIKIVKAMAAQLDVEAASAANSVRVFPLQFASSDRVSGLLRDLFRQRETQPDMREEDKLIITSDVRTNSLIIATSPKSFAVVEGMLRTLDGEKSNFSVGLHVVPVTNSDVRTLAPRIDRLMRERISAAAQSGSIRNPLDAFSIEPEPLNNLLIIASSDENLAVVKELISTLTSDAAKLAAGERVDMVQLTKARAAEVAASLQELYVTKELARRGPNAVSVTANERLNAIVLGGNEQDMIELRTLAKRLDGAEVAATQQIKWIELKSANATEVVNLIEAVIAGRPVGGGRGVGARQASKLQFLRETVKDNLVARGDLPTEAEIDGAIRDQVLLTADPRTNSIWITAPQAMATLISEMILEIERSSAGARRIEKFTLVNADARQMAELLKDTFKLEQRGNTMVLLPQGLQRRDDVAADSTTTNVTPELPSVTAVPDERQQLAIAVDARTNTLVVSGTEEYLELVRKVIKELDSIEANERERRVYALRNAKATEIQATLRNYFRGENDAERSTLGPQLSGSLMRRLEQEVTVVGDEKSNKLVISTSPRYMQTVLSIIDELDTPPPQVMIQVLLAEVTLDSSEQWGMDVSVGPFGGEGYKIGSLAGGSGVATALGVPNLSVSSADFGILIRSLEAQGKLEILSNPQVTVNNNQKAEINVGDEIGVAGSTERSSVGTLISSVERLPVGIIMNVTPAISDDGFVRMEINPEISQLTNRTTQINRDQTAPIIARRKVDTVVTVKDGQSVVIGGLIQTTQEERRSKVPVLGDIPLIGFPFRTKIEEAKKTELLVIVTPRVIPGIPGAAHGAAEDVMNQNVEKMEDPSRVLDYLESIKSEIKATRERQLRRSAEPTSDLEDFFAPSSPDAPIPAPAPAGTYSTSPDKER